MSKKIDAESVAAPPAADLAAVITIEQFCSDLSLSSQRVELISAFFRVETAAGRVTATVGEFRKGFDDFTNAPV